MKNCMVQTCPVLLLFHSSWPTFKTEGKKKKKNYMCTEKWETVV